MHIRRASRWMMVLALFLSGPIASPAQQPEARRAPRPSAGEDARPQREKSSARPAGKPMATAKGDRQVRPAADLQPADGQRPQQPPPAAKAPFRLTEAEQSQLDQILGDWEKSSNKVQTFKCEFRRWEYDRQNGIEHLVDRGGRTIEGEMHGLKSIAEGEIKYKSPDYGSYKDNSVRTYNAPANPIDVAKMPPKQIEAKLLAKDPDACNHWVCDGNAIYEYILKEKVLKQHNLPPEMKGNAIKNGPIPFVFGAKAEDLRRRYWLRVVTRASQEETEIWLEAIPRYQADAAEFRQAMIVLSKKTLLPMALRTTAPGDNQRTDYAFGKPTVNSILDKLDFLPPTVHLGWRKIVEEAPATAGPQAPAREAARPSGKPRTTK